MTCMRFPLVLLAILALGLGSATGAADDEVGALTAGGNTVFLVLTDASATGLEKARALAKQAQERTPNSAIVEMNRSDPAQREAVAKYRVAGAPVPLVMVIARNGLPVGAARPAARDALGRLLSLVPSKGKAEYLKILHDKQIAMVVFSRASMEERSPLFEQITALSATPNTNISTVLVDLDDKSERTFIAQWKIVPGKIKKPLVMMVNPKGQLLGQLEGAPTAAQMIELSKVKLLPCGCREGECDGHG